MLSAEERAEIMLEEAEATNKADFNIIKPFQAEEIDSSLEQSLIAGKDVIDGGPTPEFHIGMDADKKVVAENTDSVNFTLGELIPPETGADLISWLMPMLAILLVKIIPGWEMDNKEIKKEMSLDSKETKTLVKPIERLFQEKTVGTKSPLLALILVFIVMFGVKLFMMYQFHEEEIDENIDNDETQRIKAITARKKPGTGKRGRPVGSTKKAQPQGPQAPRQQLPDLILPPSNVTF